MYDRLNLIDTIAKEDKFSTFARLMASSGANDVFSGPGDFTVFVPTNDAFAKVPDAKMSEFLNEADQTKLKSLLSYHVMPGKVMAASIGSKRIRTSFTGEELTFSDSNGLKVNSSSIQARNIEATNGVVHGLDTVLTPSAETPAMAFTATASTGIPPTPEATPSPTPGIVATPSASSALPTSPSVAAERSDIKSIL